MAARGAGVPDAVHELPQRRAALRGPGTPGVPQVVQVEIHLIGDPGIPQSTLPEAVEVAPSRDATLRSAEPPIVKAPGRRGAPCAPGRSLRAAWGPSSRRQAPRTTAS